MSMPPSVSASVSDRRQLVAVDLGASSGRVILADVGPDRLDLREVRRFGNGPVPVRGSLYWDVLGLYREVLAGLGEAGRAADAVAGLAVDSWAVDYGLLDADGELLGNPFHYRDPRTARGVADVHARVDAGELYEVNGLQHLPFNTVFQLAADRERLARAARVLLVPDLLGFWLTGEQLAEQTNASTTGLLDARTGLWSDALLDRVGLPRSVLPDVVPAGELVGGLSAAVRDETGLPAAVTLSTVGSHDTASAVVGVPAETENFAYISCGTWGLVGVELSEPVLTDDSRAANFTNERGVDGTIRYLRNVMGLWLLQESLRDWRLRGVEVELDALLDAAGHLPSGGPTVDVDSAEFLEPGDMPARIARSAAARGFAAPQRPDQIVRCILDSLAGAFARAVADAARLAGRTIDVVHIVGGGSQNALLCRLTADACGRPVLAGPVEATAIGNVLVQARTHGMLSGDRWTLRALVRATHPIVRYAPGSRP